MAYLSRYAVEILTFHLWPPLGLDNQRISIIVNHMVNDSTALDYTFIALSNPVRRNMIARLMQGWATVGDLAEPFDISAPAVTKHLRILARAGLITRKKRGRKVYIHLVVDPMRDATEWLSFYKGFWNRQFESLADFLSQEENA